MTFKRTLVALLLTVPMLVGAQAYKFGGNSEVKVEGTSNVHDWSAVVEDVRATATYEDDDLASLRVEFIVESMESGEKLMNKRIYKTLNSDEHPKIVFVMSSSQHNGSSLSMTGNLTINGVTKRVTVTGTITELANGDIKISGSHPVLFSNFGMTAPSFMLGAMKVGDEVKIVYNVTLTR